jgi:large subunit ribosomal protein L16
MGKGKGEPEYWAAVVKPGTVMYEIAGVAADVAKEVLSRIAHKMPVKTRMVKRRGA